MRKLLVAVDGSGAALRALHAAVSLAKLVPDSSIHVVHAHEAPRVYGELQVYVPPERMRALQREHSEAFLDRAEAELKGTGLRHTREVLEGPVGRTIAEHAERIGCDAIIMGRHGESALNDILMGSVAMKVLHASRLPVLLVR
ncbi:MAG TPA: universal stress protein [Burkholderiales bacterium]|nr:universal stress protein [Burkholderiales bacterium]